MTTKFHLGWFTNFTSGPWKGTFDGDGTPWNGRFFIDFAQMLERACFDFILFEDKLAIPEAYGGTSEVYLAQATGFAPKGDPAPLAALLAGATSHLGLVATLSTLSYHPYTLARLASTIDGLSEGRFGWNIVTSAEDAAARNMGLAELPPRELRYEVANEFVEATLALWRSWEPGAVMRDRERGVYVDFNKVKPVDFVGRYYRTRGPLNTFPSPQVVPALIQAGASPKGRDFAAKYADAVVGAANGVAGMKALRDDIRSRAEGFGRDPDDIKVLFLVAPELGETEQEARDRYARKLAAPDFVERSLAAISALTDIDFKQFDPDAPLPETLSTNGEASALDFFRHGAGLGKTLREMVIDTGGGLSSSMELIGSPEQVADRMEEAMAEIGGDGFLITMAGQAASRRTIIEVCEGLVPVLQRRGLVRTAYDHVLLRDNLLAF
jgi:FMN-dependent oxidoreductase (nitrilotriacetate monooxygenase family)